MNSILIKTLVLFLLFLPLPNEITKIGASLTGEWTGLYSWECGNSGKENVILKLKDKKGVLSGSILVHNSTFEIKGYRLENATLGEWKYEGGKLSKKGSHILLQILDPANRNKTINIFSGVFEKSRIKGITMNGKDCSGYKGPSGHFAISRQD